MENVLIKYKMFLMIMSLLIIFCSISSVSAEIIDHNVTVGTFDELNQDIVNVTSGSEFTFDKDYSIEGNFY